MYMYIKSIVWGKKSCALYVFGIVSLIECPLLEVHCIPIECNHTVHSHQWTWQEFPIKKKITVETHLTVTLLR